MSVEDIPFAGSTTYTVQVVHKHSEGIVASPIAGKGPKNVSLVRWHAPYEIMSVYWTAVSEGTPPRVPSHKGYISNYNRVFLGGERVGVITPSIVGHIFHMAGRLDFAIVAPEGLDSEFDLAKCPWEDTSISDFQIPAAYFLDSGILNAKWNQPKGIQPLNAIVGALNQELAGAS